MDYTGLFVLIAFVLSLVVFAVGMVAIAKLTAVKRPAYVAPVRRATSAPVPALPGR